MAPISIGAFLPYQIGAMRPIPEFGSYRSPVCNLYLCGASRHPGSGVTMAPGRNAAKAISVSPFQARSAKKPHESGGRTA